MIFKEEYDYRLITKYTFDSKTLEIKTFNDIYRKYKIVKHKKDGKIQFDEIIFGELIDKIENIIKVYDAEKIVSSCRGFDGRYDELIYYHIDDLYFIEYKNDEFGDENQNDEVKKELERKGLILN